MVHIEGVPIIRNLQRLVMSTVTMVYDKYLIHAQSHSLQIQALRTIRSSVYKN